MIRCQRCGDDRHLPLTTLVARYGPTPRLEDVVRRLLCRFPSCRSRPDLVRFLNRHASEAIGDVQEMVLVGYAPGGRQAAD